MLGFAAVHLFDRIFELSNVVHPAGTLQEAPRSEQRPISNFRTLPAVDKNDTKAETATMTEQSVGLMAAGLLSACLVLSAPAQESAAPANTNPRPNTPSTTPSKYAPGVDEILKMMQAGVSTQVMLNYVENSPIPYRLDPADIITLKQQAVPDDVTTAMLKRGAALRAQMDQARSLAKAPSRNNARYSGLDPEGYDYFQYYYFYPRTLAAANQQLYSYGPWRYGYAPYAYGYAPPPFYALPPSAFRRR